MRGRGGFQYRRGARPQRGGVQSARVANPRPKIKFNISVSSDESDSSDIPMINTPVCQTSRVPAILVSDSSDLDSDQSDDVEKKEVNWNSQNPRKVEAPHRSETVGSINMRKVNKGRFTHRQPQIKDENIENNDNDKVRANNNATDDSTEPSAHSKESQANDEVEIKVAQMPSDKVEKQMDEPKDASEHNEPQSKAAQASPVNNDVDMTEKVFSIIREGKKFLRKEEMTMLENDKAVFFALEAKDQISKYYMISKKQPVAPDSPDFQGIARLVQNGKYLVISKDEIPNDDREGELCGVSVSPITIGKKKAQKVTIALTSNGEPRFSISRRQSLANVASDENDDQKENIIKYSSLPPQIDEKGNITINLDNIYMLPCIKNTMIVNDEGTPIFVLYKTSNVSYGVRCKYPITPYTAFCLGILLTSS